NQITTEGLGQSTCVGIGGDMIVGSNFVDVLRLFKDDKETEAVVLIGEIGGSMEEDAAVYIKTEFNKPVFAYIAGRFAPSDKKMGHGGAIISGGKGSADSKIDALRSAEVEVVINPTEIGKTVKKWKEQRHP
ncbi:MAG: succinate--CoA ligase subunit alpha, partial [Nitrospirota bacterium]